MTLCVGVVCLASVNRKGVHVSGWVDGWMGWGFCWEGWLVLVGCMWVSG